MEIVVFVNDFIDRKFGSSIEKIQERCETASLNELQSAFDFVFRSKKETSDLEKAKCFEVLYAAIRKKSQYPTYRDFKDGGNPKKINDLTKFLEYNRDSIYRFVQLINIENV